MKEITTDSFPRNTLQQCEDTACGWEQLKDKLNVPGLTLDKFRVKIQKAKELTELAERLKEERSKAVKNRNVSLKEVWDWTKRIRNSGKATFGDQSPEVEKLGLNTIRSRRRLYRDNQRED